MSPLDRKDSNATATDASEGATSTTMTDEHSSNSTGRPSLPRRASSFLQRQQQELGQTVRNLGVSTRRLIHETALTLRMADGDTESSDRNREDDVYCNSRSEGFALLVDMVHEARRTQTSGRYCQKWNFCTVPLELLDCTMDDIYMSFLFWSRSRQNVYNVSKAFRRLDSYATWMENTGRDLIDPPLTLDSIEKAFRAWDIQISHDKEGRFVYWFDLARVQAKVIKREVSHLDTQRSMVWLTHIAMLDKGAQEHGMVVACNMDRAGFWEASTLVPPPLAIKLDRFTLGTIPIQTHGVFLVNAGGWLHVAMGILKPFLSPKMRERVQVLDNDSGFLEAVLGANNIPKEFGACGGTLEKDYIVTHFPQLGPPDDATSTTAVMNDEQ